MKENLWGICLTFLYVKTCISLASNDKVLAEAGKDATLPCGKDTNGEISWLKDNIRVIRYIKQRRLYDSNTKGDKDRFSVPSHRNNDLSLKDVKMIDSGTYTCQHQQSNIRTVELFVFQVSVSPSTSLLLSEDLVLELTSSPSPVPGSVSWEKDGTKKSTDLKLEENNVQLNSKGRYVCHIKIDGKRLDITTEITVLGFHDPPPIVYTSGKSPVIVPWIFNFNIREKPLISEVHVEEGFIAYPSNDITQLDVMEGAASWPATSKSKDASQISNDLSIHLLNPKVGQYRMEIQLRIKTRKKSLKGEVYLASLTVSDSKSDISPNTKVILDCSVDRIDIKWTLCWHQWKTSQEKCGEPGKKTWNTEVPAGNETGVTWICSVTNGKERLVSANVTLADKSDLLAPSISMLWVMVGAGIFILLLTVVFITLVIAWKRRARRARHRAWLLENLHQQRRCECKGFSPQRLKENI